MTRRIKLTIKDTLGCYNEILGDYTFDPDAAQTTSYWFALPNSAFDGDDIRPEFREPLFQTIYGPNWRRGNPDHCKHVILHVQPALPSDEEEKARPWESDHAKCIIISESGIPTPVNPAEF
jgi:hypothetical protein